MNTNEIKSILQKVRVGKPVNRNTLRVVAKELKAPIKPKKDELVQSVLAVAKSDPRFRGPGRPEKNPENIIGYKVKIGLRYPTESGGLTTNMRDGKLFQSEAECQTVIDKLVADGQIRVWGGKVRAKILPRYGKES